eukprot:6206230-Pleurochrysis_carterae.AAC.1
MRSNASPGLELTHDLEVKAFARPTSAFKSSRLASLLSSASVYPMHLPSELDPPGQACVLGRLRISSAHSRVDARRM